MWDISVTRYIIINCSSVKWIIIALHNITFQYCSITSFVKFCIIFSLVMTYLSFVFLEQIWKFPLQYRSHICCSESLKFQFLWDCCKASWEYSFDWNPLFLIGFTSLTQRKQLYPFFTYIIAYLIQGEVLILIHTFSVFDYKE